MDVVLVLCPPWQTVMPPLWPSMLMGSLRAAGWRGVSYDLNSIVWQGIPAEARSLWQMDQLFRWRKEDKFEAIWAVVAEQMQRAVAEILALHPRVVGFSTTEASMRCAIRLAEMIKEQAPETAIVVGGPGIFWTERKFHGEFPVNLYDSRTTRPLDPRGVVDVYLRGEADESFPQLLYHLQQGLDPLDVPGVMVLRREMWHSKLPPRPPERLDSIPFPDYSDLQMASYPGRFVPLITSRGCIRSCAFCNDFCLQGQHRVRSAEHVFGEVLQLKRRYDIDGVAQLDLLLNGDLAQLERFCDLVIERDISLQWGGQALVRPGMRPALLEKMARAGCNELTFGLESLCDAVLNDMRKGFSVAQAAEVLGQTRAAGISTAVNFLVGFPTETAQMFDETLANLVRHREVIARVQAVNACHLTYRSQLWDEPETFGVDASMREPWYRWRTTAGLGYDERKRRLRALHATLDQIGLGIAEENLYDEGQREEGAAELSAEQLPELQIVHTKLLNPRGEMQRTFVPGDALTIAIGYRARRPVREPLFRVQIFNDENPLEENTFIFGTNTARFEPGLGTLDQGEGEVCLDLRPLNLGPGTYAVTLGIWPTEQSEQPFDVLHGHLKLRVDGELDADGRKLHMPTSWTVRQQAPAPGSEGDAGEADRLLQRVQLQGIELDDGLGRPATRCVAGGRLRASATCEIRAALRGTASARIYRQGRPVHHSQQSLALQPGAWRLTIDYPQLVLLEGDYEIGIGLSPEGGDAPAVDARASFAVQGRRSDGAGLVYIPATWRRG